MQQANLLLLQLKSRPSARFLTISKVIFYEQVLAGSQALPVVSDFHAALGQCLNYRLALQMNESDRILYLAVPLDTYESFCQEAFTQAAVRQYEVKLMIYEPLQEVIVEWKD